MKQKKSTKTLYSVWFYSAILAAILAAGAIVTDYDENANYFLKSAPVFWAALACAGISLISGIAAAFTTNLTSIRKSPFPKKPVFLPSSLCFVLMIVALNNRSLEGKTISGLLTFILTVVSLAIALFYSILSGRPEKIEQKPMQLAGFGLFAILAPLFVNIHFYFDVSVEMNAPLKLLVQIGLLLAMLYYTAELRYLLGKPKPRLFLILCIATVSVGSLSALSLFVALITSRLPSLDYLAGAILVLGVMITAIFRLITLFNPDPEPIATETEPAPEVQFPDTPNDFSDNI